MKELNHLNNSHIIQNESFQENIHELMLLGNALFIDPEIAFQHTSDTLLTLKTLKLENEILFERATAALIFQALKKPNLTATTALSTNSYFQLEIFDRFILCALHLCQWSYEKCARILNIPLELFQRRAWTARVRLFEKIIHNQIDSTVHYPIHIQNLGPHCPEFNKKEPWTQKFLDEETGKKELFFLQNHAMACASCLNTLNQTRKNFFAIENYMKSTLSFNKKNTQSQEYKLLKKWNSLKIRSDLYLLFQQGLLEFAHSMPFKLFLMVTAFFLALWFFS